MEWSVSFSCSQRAAAGPGCLVEFLQNSQDQQWMVLACGVRSTRGSPPRDVVPRKVLLTARGVVGWCFVSDPSLLANCTKCFAEDMGRERRRARSGTRLGELGSAALSPR